MRALVPYFNHIEGWLLRYSDLLTNILGEARAKKKVLIKWNFVRNWGLGGVGVVGLETNTKQQQTN